MCAIGLPGVTGTSALPSIIGPASALFRPQKSHNTGGWAGYELPSVVTLVTPHRNCSLQCRPYNDDMSLDGNPLLRVTDAGLFCEQGAEIA